MKEAQQQASTWSQPEIVVYFGSSCGVRVSFHALSTAVTDLTACVFFGVIKMMCPKEKRVPSSQTPVSAADELSWLARSLLRSTHAFMCI